MVVTTEGEPVEVRFHAGSICDVSVLWNMELEIPSGSSLYADGAYNCFDLEDVLGDSGIKLLAKRGKKAKNRKRNPSEERCISSKRQIIETAFSSITNLLPRHIRANTEKGFLVKVMSAILAYSLSFLAKGSLI